MRQIQTRNLRLYGAKGFLLLETGVGKLNAAAATGALLQLQPDVSAVVNIGIAGGLHDYGEVITSHHVRDQSIGLQWFPHLPSGPVFRQFTSSAICTVDAPVTHYSADTLWDMECSGIFSAACQYLSSAQVHSVKVISDNPDNNIQAINKRRVLELMKNAVPGITQLLTGLTEHINQMAPEHLDALELWVSKAVVQTHHSVNDELQLRQLLRRYVAITSHLPELPTDSPSSKWIRQSLQQKVSDAPFTYGTH